MSNHDLLEHMREWRAKLEAARFEIVTIDGRSFYECLICSCIVTDREKHRKRCEC